MGERERSAVTAANDGHNLPALLSFLLHAALLVVWALAPRPAAAPLPVVSPVQIILGDGDAVRPGEEEIAGASASHASSSPATAALIPAPRAALPAKRPSKEIAPPRPAPPAASSIGAEAASSAKVGDASRNGEGAETNAMPGNQGTGDGGGKAVRVPDDSEIQAYLASVRRQVQEALIYPSAARRLRLSGAVDLSFAILADGQVNPDSLRIIGGSSDSLLREGALDTIRALAKLPPPPVGAMTVELAVVFNLTRS